MSLRRSTLISAVLLALGATATAAQSRAPSPVWRTPFPERDSRWETRDGRDSDSDRDSDRDSDSDRFSDRDSDSDSDGRRTDVRRGGVFDRDGVFGRGERGRSDERSRAARVNQELARIHDEWHRSNDRDRNDRSWQRRHQEMHAQLERARRQANGSLDRTRSDRRPGNGRAGSASGRAGGVIR